MNQQGFTLLELLIVMTIVGILSAIAIPQYTAYKARAFDTRAQMDLRNVALGEEAYFLDNELYLSCANEACFELPGLTKLSPGVEVDVEADESSFIAESTHPKGSGKTYVWDSDGGGQSYR